MQVLPLGGNSKWKDKKGFEQILLTSVLSSTGKYGAYGQPYNIQVRSLQGTCKVPEEASSQQQQQLFGVTFTSLTPAMRESERKVLIQAKLVDDDTLVLLVVGTTIARFPSNEATIRNVVDSFEAIRAPDSKLR